MIMYGRKEQPQHKISVNLCAIISWWRGRTRDKLRAGLKTSRERYRKALGWTEKELYADMEDDV